MTDIDRKHPAFIAYSVRDGKEGKGRWTEIGAAWATKTVPGFVIHLHAMPLDGRVVLVTADKR